MKFILGTFTVIEVLGIPKNLGSTVDRKKRILLQNLPGALRAYGKSLQYGSCAVIVVVDLDDRDCTSFKSELLTILNACNPKPNTLFRIAIEEGEAWLLGDRAAVQTAYPQAKTRVLNSYIQDSICGTWEKLADAIHPGGAESIKKQGWPSAGQAKCEWARKIAPYMNVEANQSQSFKVFRDGVRRLAGLPVT